MSLLKDIWKVVCIQQIKGNLMKEIKLTIDLLPRGAWGNDFSKTLSQKDWNTLRYYCYKRFFHSCAICGVKDEELDAHEVWRFDKPTKTQTLIDIVALCPKCHGVKHMRNTERIGFGENAKRHFLKINNCDQMVFVNHYIEQQLRFEELNEVLRWEVVADLGKFGGKGIDIKQRILPLINNPYTNIDWANAKQKELFNVVEHISMKNSIVSAPKVRYIEVDNYSGAITVVADYANKIEWLVNKEIKKFKFNICGKFVTKFNVENLIQNHISFKLIGDNGESYSKEFKLIFA